MCSKFPQKIIDKANQLIKQYEDGVIKARRSHKRNYLVLEVSLRYRLLNKGNTWVLLTHEKYNKEVLR